MFQRSSIFLISACFLVVSKITSEGQGGGGRSSLKMPDFRAKCNTFTLLFLVTEPIVVIVGSPTHLNSELLQNLQDTQDH